MSFKKAVKYKSKLRCAMFGPSGSGKTMSALRIGSGIGGKIAVIDSERGSASKYADKFNFDVDELEKKTIDEYVEKIIDASKSGYNVLIIDSLSHAWQELLEEVDRIAKAKYKGNTWSAWNEGTPKQKKLVNSILSCNCHIISTMRSKTEWTLNSSENGKVAPTRVGLSPEQGKGIEYEFDMLIEINMDHIAYISKDRTSKFQDNLITLPDEKFGKALIDWLNEGAEKPKPQGNFEVARQAIENENDIEKVLLMQKRLPTRQWNGDEEVVLYDMCAERITVLSSHEQAS